MARVRRGPAVSSPRSRAGEGSVGYADASQIGDLGAAKVGVGDEFVEYSPEAAAKLVEVSTRVEGRSEYDLAFDLDRGTTEAGVYPITLVSYHIVCLQYDDQAKADLVKSFMACVGSEEGQEAAAAAAGSAPLSAEHHGPGPGGGRSDLGRLIAVVTDPATTLPAAGRTGPSGSRRPPSGVDNSIDRLDASI